jgi:hypothetical protein
MHQVVIESGCDLSNFYNILGKISATKFLSFFLLYPLFSCYNIPSELKGVLTEPLSQSREAGKGSKTDIRIPAPLAKRGKRFFLCLKKY